MHWDLSCKDPKVGSMKMESTRWGVSLRQRRWGEQAGILCSFHNAMVGQSPPETCSHTHLPSDHPVGDSGQGMLSGFAAGMLSRSVHGSMKIRKGCCQEVRPNRDEVNMAAILLAKSFLTLFLDASHCAMVAFSCLDLMMKVACWACVATHSSSLCRLTTGGWKGVAKQAVNPWMESSSRNTNTASCAHGILGCAGTLPPAKQPPWVLHIQRDVERMTWLKRLMAWKHHSVWSVGKASEANQRRCM